MMSDQIYSSFEVIIKKQPNFVSKGFGTYWYGQHQIQLSADTIPFGIKTRPIPYAIREKVADAVCLLDKQGIWEPADKGDWAHPLMMPAKSDGMVRITTDLSRLNKYVIPRWFDILTLADIFHMVLGSHFFSTLDLMKAYYHIPLDPESRPLTLMMTPLGPRQYVKPPLGLKDFGAAFQRAIHETLKDCPGVVPYVDDILVYGRTQAEHDQNLEQVLRCLHTKNFHLQLSKCKFCKSEVLFLGQILSGTELQPSLSKVKAITDVPALTNLQLLGDHMNKSF